MQKSRQEILSLVLDQLDRAERAGTVSRITLTVIPNGDVYVDRLTQQEREKVVRNK